VGKGDDSPQRARRAQREEREKERKRDNGSKGWNLSVFLEYFFS
jgi:hypothetical protein